MADCDSPQEYLNDQITGLSAALSEYSVGLRGVDDWPAAQLARCAEAGVFRWFIGQPWGGWGWDEASIVDGYVRLSAGCMTTAFVITQRTAACRRIESSDNEWLKTRLLPDLASGDSFATVGISHLTTSRQHLARPVMTATPVTGGFELNGFSPWVTGAAQADHIVVGASLDDGTQLLAAVPRDLAGASCAPSSDLIALSASQTGEFRCAQALVEDRYIVNGPMENVMQRGGLSATGGLQTSALSIGLSDAAIGFVEEQAQKRDALIDPAVALREDWRTQFDLLIEMAHGRSETNRELLRASANSLVLRATQAAMTAAKGSGFVADHRVGRWCREALFFLVWSCPHEVQVANICEFAGISDG